MITIIFILFYLLPIFLIHIITIGKIFEYWNDKFRDSDSSLCLFLEWIYYLYSILFSYRCTIYLKI